MKNFYFAGGIFIMDINQIIEELSQKHIIVVEKNQYEQLAGGTVSDLFLLTGKGGDKYVVKFNVPQVIRTEAYFLNTYKNNALLPKLLYTEPSNKFIVYSFIPGSTNYSGKNKSKMLKQLVLGMINHYQVAPNETGWGWADEVTDSWHSFLFNRITEAKQVLGLHLRKEEFDFVNRILESQKQKRVKPYLLHGDCGVHNFIFKDNHLCGVIDPTPVMGEPIYDLIYAFCSSPDDLTKETIEHTVNYMEHSSNYNLYEEVIIGLYLRMATCVKHHSYDFNEYLNAWSYWKDIYFTFR
jgi:fructosamine-3-kinase